METPEGRLRNRLQVAVSALELAARRLDALVDRGRPPQELASELREVAASLRRAAASAVRE